MTEPAGPTRDRSRYVIPLAVAVIAAIATIVAALLPLLLRGDPGRPSPAGSVNSPRATRGTAGASTGATEGAGGAIWVEGFEVLAAMFGDDADLDADSRGNCGDKVPDIVVTEEALKISDGARLAVLDKDKIPRLDTCTAEIAERAVDSVAERDIQAGTALCYRTSAGRIGMLTISQARKSTQNDVSTIYMLTFNYVTWAS